MKLPRRPFLLEEVALYDYGYPNRKHNRAKDQADDHPGPHIVVFRLNFLLVSHDPKLEWLVFEGGNSASARAVPPCARPVAGSDPTEPLHCLYVEMLHPVAPALVDARAPPTP
jgi:hypothetical protein